jgi:GNAT superfamily N-acetyltransferase
MPIERHHREWRLRPLSPHDDLAALTALLHRAYAGLAARGMRFWASHQSVDDTRKRTADGECWVAVAAGSLIGTITLRDAANTRGCAWYDRPDVAAFGQFGVDPAWQGRGVGAALLDVVEHRARETGVAELALDTAEGAADLIALYARRGFRFVQHVTWDKVNYRSVVMSKPLAATQSSRAGPPRPL